MCLRLIAEADARSVGDSHPSCQRWEDSVVSYVTKSSSRSGPWDFLIKIDFFASFGDKIVENDWVQIFDPGSPFWALGPFFGRKIHIPLLLVDRFSQH